MAESKQKTDESQAAPQQEKPRVKVTPSDIYTPSGSRQDILDEYSRLVKELEGIKYTGKKKFHEDLKKKDIQMKKSLEPSVEEDMGKEMPVDGDYVNGSRVFMRNCASCHSLESGNQGIASVMGPPLGLIYGKKAGSDRYFNYSDSYVHSSRTWTEKFLFHYLQNPKKFFPDSKCVIKDGGLKDETERADISKFLRLFTKNLRIYLNNKAKKTFGQDYIENYNRAQKRADQATYRNTNQ